MKNLRRGRDEVVQDDGACGLKPETFQIVSQFVHKKESGDRPEIAYLWGVLTEVKPPREAMSSATALRENSDLSRGANSR